ncbi:hypothetical protein GCM10027586_06660 [Kineococcus gypseus]|uniref:nucleotidyltransferase domain-containing protein n=1 Tax=Kineococcus gypseus TaxID=1637102 RepID=UPI003D7CDD82
MLADAVLAAVGSTAAVEALLLERLAGWDPPAQAVVVFGSWARGEAGPDSDLDLLLVRRDAVDVDGAWGEQVHATGQAVEVLTGNAVQFVQVTLSQLVTAVHEDQPLIRGLRQDARVLVGPPLRALLAAGATA